eukprot:CAMPEP_0203759896 /NCGR_PEP_ID=MMETSP0098-20131031/13208_1 /ASSEMBLY_ACC=CAM_ASM_000208 /TAXON_ID=96639 /ORGANISM=" , Strain NY0313808BC1" /LENGTH=310 /DNA_ID=CAMNT_0050653203 /DNA_START=193 /DNA_END=1122 /DNA_ORIENTATION=+
MTHEERQRMCSELGVAEEKVFLSIKELREWRTSRAMAESSVGFVPTMGALHQGHISLLGSSTAENQTTVASIFVNPAQFAPHEDFGKYPRNARDDLANLFENNADYVFLPTQDDMYPGSKFGQTSKAVTKTHVVPDGIDFISEGAARPGFFTGVATVVCKLLNIVQPTNAYFGQKDGLQVIVIRRMVRDLNIPTRIVPCETIREDDGLAMSSRNIYLSKEQRKVAPRLYETLKLVKSAYEQGERDYARLIDLGNRNLEMEPLFQTEYLSICNSLEGEECRAVIPEENVMVSAAVNFGDCRILDNVLMGKQ